MNTYASGEEPMIGDVVQHVKTGGLADVVSLDRGYVIALDGKVGYSLQPRKFTLINRTAATTKGKP